MHEFSLMDNIIGAVENSTGENNIRKVTVVKLIVGKLTMAQPDSLRFAFEVLAGEKELFKDSRLEIEQRDPVGKCRECEHEFSIEKLCFQCQRCGSSGIELISGRELFIEYYEGE